MLRVPVDVEPRHIKKGIRGNPGKCAIALALKTSLRKMHLKAKSMCVCSETELRLKDGDYQATLPAKADKFIDQFDTGMRVKPISFVLRFKKVK